MQITNTTIEQIASKHGFKLVGFAKAEPTPREIEKLEIWLRNGYHAGMQYMEKNLEKRLDIRNILPSAESVISLGMNYFTKEDNIGSKERYKISRYAWGKDYHLIIWDKLKLIFEELKSIDSSVELISYVDTGPVMDKVWAQRAGLGWIGKHSNLINKGSGSWFFIANIFINKELDYSTPVSDLCGTCTKCIDACPTDAIVREYVVDANKCISYLTIENKGGIGNEFKGKFDNYIFGCDICQDVCPWNLKFSVLSENGYFHPQNNNDRLTDIEIKEMDEKEFNERFLESPLKRAKLAGLKRNAAFLSEG
ncbi:MAG: tRNA epoxyqueuosine(34) reductase QueG [Ignavibacteriaceae bacterium]